MAKISIILPCRNERGHIEKCLASLLNQAEPAGGFEVIVAEGMSEDGTREILARLQQEFSSQGSAASDCSVLSPQPLPLTAPPLASATALRPSSYVPCPPPSELPSPISHLPSPHPGRLALRVIDNPGRIVSTGLNAAIRAAHGDIIIRLDAHTEYAPDYVRSCVEILQETGADNVGGPARTKADTYLGRAIAAAYHSPFAVGGARFHNVEYEGEVDTVTYGCWPRGTFEKFGIYDEELVRNQDDEHNLRITRGGGRVYQSPKIRSWYRPRSSLGALFQQYLQYGYWKVRVIQKHQLPASWRHLVPGAFVMVLLTLLLTSVLGLLFSVPPLRISAFRFPLSAFTLSFLSLLFAYSLALMTASLITAGRTEWKLLPVLPLVFPCYHFGYGLGFLRGLWDFVLRRKAAGDWSAGLTRRD